MNSRTDLRAVRRPAAACWVALVIGSAAYTPAWAGTYQAIYAFQGYGASDGQNPLSGLTQDSQGRLYGTTMEGGTIGLGTVFRLTAPASGQGSWSEEILHSFAGAEGFAPNSRVTLGADGSIYGTAPAGGAFDVGVVYGLTNAPNWPLTVLHAFSGTGTDGALPNGGVLFGAGGLLYGTTPENGAYTVGTAYSVSPAGDQVEYAVIHAFGATNDGAVPNGLASAATPGFNGFVGTTQVNIPCCLGAVGTVFSLSNNPLGTATESVLYYFLPAPNVNTPVSPPIQGRGKLVGALFGCGMGGGKYNQGGIYELVRNSGGRPSETKLYDFGAQPGDPAPTKNCYLVQGENSSTIYGTSDGGGAYNKGAFFELNRPTIQGRPWTEKVDVDFNGNNAGGSLPQGAPLQIGKYFYGTTYTSPNGFGSVYGLTP